MTTVETVTPSPDAQSWSGVEIRSFAPDLEVLPRTRGGDGRTVTGILVPYGVRQRISPTLEEMFRRGSANHQLRAPNRMKFSRGHLRQGGILIGRAVELRDDAAGLWGALRASATPDGDETLTLIEDGALDELSIGFRTRQDKRHPDGLVERTRVDILETAAVIEGAYGRKARVTGLRSQDGADLGDEHDDQDGEHDDAPGRSLAELRAALVRRRVTPAGRSASGLMIR